MGFREMGKWGEGKHVKQGIFLHFFVDIWEFFQLKSTKAAGKLLKIIEYAQKSMRKNPVETSLRIRIVAFENNFVHYESTPCRFVGSI